MLSATVCQYYWDTSEGEVIGGVITIADENDTIAIDQVLGLAL
jgi:hypothetical protein